MLNAMKSVYYYVIELRRKNNLSAKDMDELIKR
jgi:hypothetical protein